MSERFFRKIRDQIKKSGLVVFFVIKRNDSKMEKPRGNLRTKKYCDLSINFYCDLSIHFRDNGVVSHNI